MTTVFRERIYIMHRVREVVRRSGRRIIVLKVARMTKLKYLGIVTCKLRF